MPVYFFQMADSETPKVDQVVGEDDDDDPAIIITWAADDVIRDAMALPERPNSLGMGANPAACKQALVAWLDTIIRKYVQRVDVCDYDNLEREVDGSYNGLRAGEWAKVAAYLTRPEIVAWQGAMPPPPPPPPPLPVVP